MWIAAVAILVSVAFIGLAVGNGVVFNDPGDTPTATTVTTLARPVLPGDSPDSTIAGASARCKDGTYSFRGGNQNIPDSELCKDNGGVEQRLR